MAASGAGCGFSCIAAALEPSSVVYAGATDCTVSAIDVRMRSPVSSLLMFKCSVWSL